MNPALPVLNISAYLFTELKDTAALREACHGQASALSLKGTVLIAEEGINLFWQVPHKRYVTLCLGCTLTHDW